VCNLPDGDVQVIAAGENEALQSFLALLKKGPAFAMVLDIDLTELPDENRFTTFTIDH
jgi:acylphosphatase